jgi:hypothetical protein
MKLVKCQIGREPETLFKCLGCFVGLKDVEGTSKTGEPCIFLCPKCHRFFNEKGVIPYEEADRMFPGESNIDY